MTLLLPLFQSRPTALPTSPMKPTDPRKAKVRRAFATLRRGGFWARMNFCCCSSCAIAEIVDLDVGENFVFYHQQDSDDLREGGTLNVRWGGNASAILEALSSEGLAVSWCGDPSKTIRVTSHVVDVPS